MFQRTDPAALAPPVVTTRGDGRTIALDTRAGNLYELSDSASSVLSNLDAGSGIDWADPGLEAAALELADADLVDRALLPAVLRAVPPVHPRASGVHVNLGATSIFEKSWRFPLTK